MKTLSRLTGTKNVKINLLVLAALTLIAVTITALIIHATTTDAVQYASF